MYTQQYVFEHFVWTFLAKLSFSCSPAVREQSPLVYIYRQSIARGAGRTRGEAKKSSESEKSFAQRSTVKSLYSFDSPGWK